MNPFSDGASAIIRLLAKTLGAGHPIRLFVGVSLSLSVKVALLAISQSIPENKALSTLSDLSVSYFILIIVPLLFFPIIFLKHGAPETAVEDVNTINLMLAKSGLSKSQQHMIWRSLITKYIDAVKPDLSKTVSVTSIFDEIAREPPA